MTPQKPKSSFPNCINTANGLINKTDAIAEEFNNHFCSIGKKLSDKVDASNSRRFSTYLTRHVSSSMFFSPVTSMEVYNIINLLNPNKSCGPNSVDVKYLKSAAVVIAPVLALLCNACLTLGVFPSCLKISKVIPIYKAGDKTNVTNYRPISLLSCFSKILEKLFYTRTIDFLNHENVLLSTQYGFRRNYSTSHAIIDILSTCYDNIEKKLYSGLVLLDLAKAFDTVDHYILLQKLDHYGLRGIVNDFLKSFLKDRSQFVSIDNSHSSLSTINIGVAQGSALGPLLFLLYINDISNSIDSTPRLFADDTCLLVTSPSLKQLKSSLTSEINRVSMWVRANKLTFNPAKSNLLIITPKLNSPSINIDIQCTDGLIKSVNKAKYLGTLLDAKLTFSDHIKALETKVSRSVGILSKLKYFLPQDALLKLYYALIHSHLNYGILAWGYTYHSYLLKLMRLQNKAIRIVTCSGWNNSAFPLFKKTNVLTIPLLFQYETAILVHRHSSNDLPVNLSNYFTLSKNIYSTRSTTNENLQTPLLRMQRTQKSIKFTGAKI